LSTALRCSNEQPIDGVCGQSSFLMPFLHDSRVFQVHRDLWFSLLADANISKGCNGCGPDSKEPNRLASEHYVSNGVVSTPAYYMSLCLAQLYNIGNQSKLARHSGSLSNRKNLSPFTKDFRGGEHSKESRKLIFFNCLAIWSGF